MTSLPFTSSYTENPESFGVDKSQKTSCVEPVGLRLLPDAIDFVNGEVGLAFGLIARTRINQPQVQRGLAALGGDLEHVVHAWIDTPFAQLFRSLGQTGNERLQFGRGMARG